MSLYECIYATLCMCVRVWLCGESRAPVKCIRNWPSKYKASAKANKMHNRNASRKWEIMSVTVRAILSHKYTHAHTHRHSHLHNQAAQPPRWAEDKNSISCWLLLQKCAFLGNLSPQGGCCSILCVFVSFSLFSCTHSHTCIHAHLDIQCMHVCMQLHQACFKMCRKREKEKNWSKKQEKRAKLHFRRRCCRSSIATCSSQRASALWLAYMKMVTKMHRADFLLWALLRVRIATSSKAIPLRETMATN